MSEAKGGEALRAAQLRFIGVVQATLGHELKNHAAVVQEYAGLIEDLVGLRRTPGKDDDDPYRTSLHAIRRQLGRTVGLLRHFGRFSHRSDAPRSVFDVNELVEDLLALVQRIASQRRASLERELDRGLPQIGGDAALLQFCLFTVLEGALGRLGRDGALLVRTGGGEAGEVAIGIVPRGKLAPDPEEDDLKMAALREALARLGARLARTGDGAATLTVPLAGPTPAEDA